MRSVSEKSPVEINHIQKTLQSRFIRGRRKIRDGKGVLGKGVEAGAGETVSQELGFRYGKLTLAQAYRQAMGAAQLQDVPEMLNMRRHIRAEDQDIINVNKTVGQITQDLIHHPLKGVPRVGGEI